MMLRQVKQYVKMESHEERLHKFVIENIIAFCNMMIQKHTFITIKILVHNQWKNMFIMFNWLGFLPLNLIVYNCLFFGHETTNPVRNQKGLVF
jgi:hypothetical protein